MEQRRVVRVLEAVASQPAGPLPERLCAAAAKQLNCSGVGLALATSDDLLAPVYATDGGRGGEAAQVDLGEGPAYAANRHGWPILVADIGNDGAWPAFSPAAAALGLRAVFAFPLRRGAVRFGALSLYRTVVGELSDDEHADALVYARLALDLLLALQADRPVDELDQLFVDGTADAIELHQATGIVSVQLGISVGAALAVLRARAYADGTNLRALASEVIARRVRLDDG